MAAELRMPQLTFEPGPHRYAVDGVELPSVTTILAGAGLVNAEYYTERCRWRGSAVHLACQLLDEQDLDHDSVDPEHYGYVEAYLRFLDDYDFKPELIEKSLWSPVFRFAGTPDRTGLINGNKAVIDLKTGAPVAADRLQLAAYESMLGTPGTWERIRLHLKADGKYSIKQYPRSEAAADFGLFLSAINVFNFRKRENLWKAA